MQGEGPVPTHGTLEAPGGDDPSDYERGEVPVPAGEGDGAGAESAADPVPGAAGEPAEPPGLPDHLVLVTDAQRVLEAVERALARLDDGSYGRCEICGDGIDDADLEADPTAERCERHLPLAHSA